MWLKKYSSVKTAEIIKSILDSSNQDSDEKDNGKTFSVLSNPEFLAEGTAIDDLEIQIVS